MDILHKNEYESGSEEDVYKYNSQFIPKFDD